MAWAVRAGLDEAEDDVQLVFELVGGGAQGVYHLFYAGDLAGQAVDFGLVAEGAHTAL